MSDFSVVKESADEDHEIQAITGATITSKAMTNGVNAVLVFFDHFLAG